jgi:hypothetical protein
MKKVNFKEIKVLNLAGVEIPDFKAHESVANILASRTTDKPVKSMELARKIFTDGEVDLLTEDLLLIKNAIIESKLLTDIAKDAILKAFE